MRDPFDALRRDISDLGRILGEVLVEQEGRELLDLVESIRSLAKERRRSKSEDALGQAVAALDTASAERLARAFAHYFQLVNLAEQHHRTRRRRDYARESRHQEGSFAHEIGRLALPKSAFEELLSRTKIELVFTAHPSEAQRRTVLEKHRHIAALLARRDRTERTPDETAEILHALREEITTLWQTDELRHEKPLVADEVKNALFYLEEVLFPLVPRFYESLERATRNVYGETIAPTAGRILTFGSWVGADMDGNPNVTGDVAIDTGLAHGARIAALYLAELRGLGDVLSQSTRRVATSEELTSDLGGSGRDRGESSFEPYRAKLTTMIERLEARREALLEARKPFATPKASTSSPPSARAARGDVSLSPLAYREPEELSRDLEVIARSLEANRGQHAGLRRVRALQRQVQTFGFHLAKLDVRLPAAWIRSNDERAQGAIRALRTIRSATGGAESLILSMSQGAADMRGALDMSEAAGLADGDVSICPLFETLADLERAAAEVEKAAEDPRYARYLDARSRVQEVMIGYSDSNKDAGILAASFALYRTQQRLVEVAKRKRLELSIFHGRGGSIGRGGGPSQRAIESLPHGSVRGRFKLTEQGEVVGWKYLLAEIAERNLELTTTGVLASASTDGRPDPGIDVTPHELAFEEVAEESLAAYRALVGDPDFVRYYDESTPLGEIARLNIGSRPARRTGKANSLDDLRAIPWVFAWTQSRQMVPGWFGAGIALVHLLRRRGLAYVRQMKDEWPFFASTLEAVAVSLATADMDIAARYAGLVSDRGVARRLFGRIAKDHGRAARAVRAIYGREAILEPESTLARSIALRNPYVDPLSFIQVELLARKRAAVDGDAPPGAEAGADGLDRAVLLTINGIAAGLRNTG